MTEQTDIIIPSGGTLAPLDNEALGFLTSSGTKRNYMNVGQGLTKECQQAIIQQGRFFLSNKDKLKSVALGYAENNRGNLQFIVEFCFLAARAKAVLFVDGKPFETSYDHTTEEFSRIKNTKAGIQNGKKVKADYGTEVLVWLPPEMFDLKDLAENSARGLEPSDIAQIAEEYKDGALAQFFFKGTNRSNSCADQQPGTCFQYRSELFEGSQNSWWMTPIRTTITPDWAELGVAAATQEVITDFRSPPKAAGESIDEGEAVSSTAADNDR